VNILCTLVGGLKLKEIWIARHTNLAKWQSKRRCCIDSSDEQKQHFLSPCHCLLAKLSFVKITPLYKYHKETLILRGSLSFYIKVLYGIASANNKALYMDFTEKNPFWCSPHTNRSLWFVNCTSVTIATTSCHACKLTPTKNLRKATFNGVIDNTVLAYAPFLLTILYKAGKIDFKGRGVIHASSQNRTWESSPSSNLPSERNSSLIFVRLAQNWESPVC
jgi:hypothetical protein